MVSWKRSPLKPLPLEVSLNQLRVDLGARLFVDPQLSHDGSISCATCHPLDQGGTDHEVTSKGLGGARGKRNAPTVFNAGLSFRQFWDGRAATLEEQVDGPLQAADEMGATWNEVLDRLRRDVTYQAQFRTAYGGPPEVRHVRDALATFERSLRTPNAPLDRYLRGETNALSALEQRGYQRFLDYGCASCHQGVGIGGNLFEALGAIREFYAPTGATNRLDPGRFAITGREEDRHVFKVPSLRNVARTAPYFHDGSAPDLPSAVRVMARHQLGHELPDEDVELLVAFLNTLTGEYRGRPL